MDEARIDRFSGLEDCEVVLCRSGRSGLGRRDRELVLRGRRARQARGGAHDALAGPDGAAAASAAPTGSVTDRLEDRRYLASGPRAYVVGSEEGRFPASGWHTRGEMGGFWTPPLKMLDGLWFGVGGQWVGPATRFTSGSGYVQMQLPDTGGVSLTRTEFAPDGPRAVLVGLTLRSPGGARTVDVDVDAHSELMQAYPWGWTTPNAADYNLPDTAGFDGRHLVFSEVGTPPVANAER